MGEFSEAGELVPLRRRTLYPAELWVQMFLKQDRNFRLLIICEIAAKVNPIQRL